MIQPRPNGGVSLLIIALGGQMLGFALSRGSTLLTVLAGAQILLGVGRLIWRPRRHDDD